MSEKLPVIAGVPNYNMASSLERLLPEILEQEYDAVYVLDDASSDHSREVVEGFRRDVKFIAGEVNAGAGANRNRIIPHLGREAIIHFIDADMQLESERNPEIARDIMPASGAGFIGGLVKEVNGRQMRFNYGPRVCLASDSKAWLQDGLGRLGESKPKLEQKLRKLAGGLLAGWPDTSAEPQPRQIFWASESNMLFKSSVFKAFPFDNDLRSHDIQAIAIRMKRAGLPRYFDPAISMIHTAVKIREVSMPREMAKAEYQLARRYGIRDWFMPDGHFRPEL